MTWGKRLGHELNFSVSRSGGPGGQNVNKVNSKVTLKFDVLHSQLLTEEEKSVVMAKLAPVLTGEGVLIVTSQESRSQLDNKQAVLAKFDKLLSKTFEKKKKRVATKSTKSSVQKRLQKKKQHSEKKQWRQKL